MSAKSLSDFFEQVEQDKGLQTKLKACQKKAKENRAKEAAELVKVAAKAGFKFSAAELVKSRKAALKKAEMSGVTGQSTCGYGVAYYADCSMNWMCHGSWY